MKLPPFAGLELSKALLLVVEAFSAQVSVAAVVEPGDHELGSMAAPEIDAFAGVALQARPARTTAKAAPALDIRRNTDPPQDLLMISDSVKSQIEFVNSSHVWGASPCLPNSASAVSAAPSHTWTSLEL
jgi:hypothetical protein